jgi:hypothetical protein
MPTLLIITIPGDTGPMDRGDIYEDPLEKALKKAGRLGQVVGGGTAFSPEEGVTSCDIEVEVKDVEKALPVIRDFLKGVKAPAGTTVKDEAADKVRLKVTKAGVKEFAAGKPKKRYVETCPWAVGEVLALKLTPKKYVLMHLYGHQMGIVVRVADWCGDAIPPADEIRRIIRHKPERHMLRNPVCAYTLAAGERDDSKIIPTGVTIPVPKRELSGIMMMLAYTHWPLFTDTLKQVFKLVKTTRSQDLFADFGFGLETVHLALWTPEEPATMADAHRLFKAYGAWFLKTHPDRVKPPVTDALKACVQDLKAAFKGPDIFRGNFGAKEGFVMIPVEKPAYKKVRPVITKLAKQHGVTLYDSDADKVYVG